MAPTINLRSFWIAKLSIQTSLLEGLEGVEAAPPSITYEVRDHREDPLRYLMRVVIEGTHVHPQAAGAKARFDLEVVGEFDTPSEWERDMAATVVRVNGGMVLYGMARGQLSLITGAFPTGPLLLPTLDWAALVKEAEAARATEAPVEKGKAPKRKAARTKKA